nr:uncharacterized protein LOC109029206 [Gorilla gorilla gorilla]
MWLWVLAAQRFSSRLLPQSESIATLTSPVAVLAALRSGLPMRVLDLGSANLEEVAGWDSRFPAGMRGREDASLEAEWRARRRRMVQGTATRRPARPASYRDPGSNPPPFRKRPGSSLPLMPSRSWTVLLPSPLTATSLPDSPASACRVPAIAGAHRHA